MRDDEAKRATPHAQLINELLDSRIPMTEREHAAAREIELLRSSMNVASDQLVGWWNGKETVWFVHELNGAPPPIEATIPLFTGETK